jgi:hypothetical protein
MPCWKMWYLYVNTIFWPDGSTDSYIKINCKKYTSLHESVFQHKILCV